VGEEAVRFRVWVGIVFLSLYSVKDMAKEVEASEKPEDFDKAFQKIAQK
jgi:hypothetical protein